MTKFKVGDRVRILDGSNTPNYRGGWVRDMEKYVGKISTIEAVDTWRDITGYELKGEPFIWDERRLELVSHEGTTAKIYIVDEVELTSHIEKVIFNNPATIVLWDDGTKTVVKAQDGETFDKWVGLAMCISKKYLGNKGNFNEVFKKYCK